MAMSQDRPYLYTTEQNDQISAFFRITEQIAEDHQVIIKLHDSEYVWERCGGFFSGDTENPELSVACRKAFIDWFLVYIHESSHMDQWIEQDPTWLNGYIGTADGADTGTLFWLWLENHIDLNDTQLARILAGTRDNELDCEIRSSKKIKQYALPINNTMYIQKANAYVFTYTMAADVRKWPKLGLCPYDIAAVWTEMPTNFDNDYTNIDPHLKELYLEHCYDPVESTRKTWFFSKFFRDN